MLRLSYAFILNVNPKTLNRNNAIIVINNINAMPIEINCHCTIEL